MRRQRKSSLIVRLIGASVMLLGCIAALYALYLPWMYSCFALDPVCVHQGPDAAPTLVPLSLDTPQPAMTFSNPLFPECMLPLPLLGLLLLFVFLVLPPGRRRVIGVVAALVGVWGLCSTLIVETLFSLPGGDTPTRHEWAVGVLISLLGYAAMLLGLGLVWRSFRFPSEPAPPAT
ncbi:MAG TPA: hypothetical protein VGR57_14465 [Ktedonobacterales bacterium]|nr:hypothetical protein [Ktedonobacterales bacterium]